MGKIWVKPARDGSRRGHFRTASTTSSVASAEHTGSGASVANLDPLAAEKVVQHVSKRSARVQKKQQREDKRWMKERSVASAEIMHNLGLRPSDIRETEASGPLPSEAPFGPDRMSREWKRTVRLRGFSDDVALVLHGSDVEQEGGKPVTLGRPSQLVTTHGGVRRAKKVLTPAELKDALEVAREMDARRP